MGSRTLTQQFLSPIFLCWNIVYGIWKYTEVETLTEQRTKSKQNKITSDSIQIHFNFNLKKLNSSTMIMIHLFLYFGNLLYGGWGPRSLECKSFRSAARAFTSGRINTMNQWQAEWIEAQIIASITSKWFTTQNQNQWIVTSFSFKQVVVLYFNIFFKKAQPQRVEGFFVSDSLLFFVPITWRSFKTNQTKQRRRSPYWCQLRRSSL